MEKFIQYARTHWPILCILAVVLFLAIVNHVPGTYLTGWDNLHPEFNFPVNLKRTIFTTWQEYQGLGLLGGMGHGAELMRQLILIVSASFIPVESLRYVFTMATLAIGGTGAYFLIRKVLAHSEKNQESTLNSRARNTAAIAFLGALFYILNLSTLQTYYTPFETFTTHFASLPWLLLATITYFQPIQPVILNSFQDPKRAGNEMLNQVQHDKKRSARTIKPLIFLSIVLLLSTPAYYVPTLFVVFLMATAILVLFLSCENKSEARISNIETNTNDRNTKIQKGFEHSRFSFLKLFRISDFGFRISRILKFYFLVFFINAFWLLPFAYFTLTNASVNLNAKINQMATENIYQLNREHGDLLSLMTLKGFWFNTVEPDLEGTNRYMYEPWRKHTGNPFIAGIGFLLFVVVLIGIISAIKRAVQNPNIEYRNSKQIQNANNQNTKRFEHSDLENSSIVSDFGFRASNLLRIELAFVVLFVFAIGMLATEVFPFSLLHTLIRELFPFINQVFRFPYTKFSILASLMYAVFFAFGVKTIAGKFFGASEQTVIANEVKSKIPEWGQSHKQEIATVASGDLAMTEKGKFLPTTYYLLLTTLLIIFVFPMFQGKLFYAKEHRAIPDEYFKLFSYFAKQDQNTRIANFPQPTFWSWNYTRWGYSGSGFLWYGIKQPILDRAFDVWSKTNEGYYFELQQALYSKDSLALSNVFEKYHVNWILIDRNITYPVSPLAVFIPELESMLSEIPSVQKAAVFNNLSVYKVALSEHLESFVYATGELPLANGYEWNTTDQAYTQLGAYITDTKYKIPDTRYYFPFRSFFSQKTEKEQSFTMQETDLPALPTGRQAARQGKAIEFSSLLPPQTAESLLVLPSLQEASFVPTEISAEKDSSGTVQLKARFMSPEVYLGGEKVAGSSSEKTLFTIRPTKPGNPTFSVKLNVNGAVNIPITDTTTEPITTFLNVTEDNILVLTDDAGRASTVALPGREIAAASFLAEQQLPLPPSDTTRELRISIPKITDDFLSFDPEITKDAPVRQCDLFRKGKFTTDFTEEDGKQYFRLKASNMTACMDFYSATLPHAQGYAIFLEYKHISGRPWHFWMVNEDEKYPVLDTFLQKKDTHTKAAFVIPPQEAFGKAYSFHLDAIAIGNERTENALHRLAIYPIPYRYLVDMLITREKSLPARPESSKIAVIHPNESLYVVEGSGLKVQGAEKRTLVLSQSYDPGWKAYAVKATNNVILNLFQDLFPFFFGKEVKNHVLINNWANGWVIDNKRLTTNDQRLVIVYLPQYLQYAGFLLLLGGLLIPGILLLRRKAKMMEL